MRKGEFSVFVTKEGKTVEYRYPVARLDEVWDRANAAFQQPLTAEDRIRFNKLMADDEARRIAQEATKP